VATFLDVRVTYTLPANTAPVVDAGDDTTGDEGAAIALAGSVTDAEGDLTTQMWSYTAGPDVDAGAVCTFADPAAAATTITCTDDGTYTVALTATDGSLSGEDSAVVAVGNVAPTASLALTGASQVACTGGNTVSATLSGSDQGSNDTLTGSIDWGDGTADTGMAASHTYAAGTYTATGVVTDDDGGMSDPAAAGASATVSLLYNTSGILQPVNADGTSNFKLGRVIPVKTRVSDCNNHPVGSLTLTVSLTKLGDSGGEVNEVVSSSSADTGDTMRFSSGDSMYIFNLSTKLSQFNGGQDLTPARYRLKISNPAINPIVVEFDLRP
jgi:hypothetical protein